MRYFIAIALLCFMAFAATTKGDCISNCVKQCTAYIDFEWCKRIDMEDYCKGEQESCNRECDRICNGWRGNDVGDEYKKK